VEVGSEAAVGVTWWDLSVEQGCGWMDPVRAPRLISVLGDDSGDMMAMG
jgi:hypothetical protein